VNPSATWISISSQSPKLQQVLRTELDELSSNTGLSLYVMEAGTLHVLSGAMAALLQLERVIVVGASFWPWQEPATDVIDKLLGDWLRPYQRELAAAALEAPMGRGVIKAPTGSGKTRILTAIIMAGRAVGIRKWVVIAPNRELLTQLLNTLHEKIGAGAEDIYPCTMRELSLRREEIVADGVLVDEAHRVGAETHAMGISRVRACWRIGLSATPLDRADGRNGLVIGLLGPVVGEVSRTSLKSDGFLTPGVVRQIIM